MSDMRQYVCWKDSAVGQVTPRDAASLKLGHFQAVHHPLKLRQRRLGTQDGGTVVEEIDVVRALEGPLTSDGYLFVPIVGRSGTGKSHLVRWVHDRTQDHVNWEQRYLAKNDISIRRVIEIVIKGLDGPAIRIAKEALLSAPAQSNKEAELAELLLDQLAFIIGNQFPIDTGQKDPKKAQLTEKLRSKLPAFLRDPVIRRKLLTPDKGVIPRIVGLALKGRHHNDGLDNNDTKVGEDDLPKVLDDIGEASKEAQDLFATMAGIPVWKSSAVRLINEALPAAIKQVFVGGKVDLITIFREIRRELKSAGKELVIFIEDLTVLHGVEKEFLDAIIEPTVSQGGDLCPLRVLLAITEGHFDSLDTVRTRVNDAYRLDTSYGDPGGVDEEEMISFVGRYLNACRHEPEEVSDRWTNRESEAGIPNACDDCQYQVSCHETFGTSEEGYGIYPFNSSALNNFVSSLSDEGFSPRLVIRELVNRFLILGSDELAQGVFPSDKLVDRFRKDVAPLPPLTQAKIKQHRANDFKRITNSMRYWRRPDEQVEDAILTAFGIEPLGTIENFLDSPPGEKHKPKSKDITRHNGNAEVTRSDKPIASQLPPGWASIFDELSIWAGTPENLTFDATNKLKQLVRKTVLENIDYSALPANLGSDFNDQKLFDLNKHIFIVGAKRKQSQKGAIITIKRDADTAAALQGLILLKCLPDAADYNGVDNYRRQTARYLEEWIFLVTSRLEQPADTNANKAIKELIECAIVLGMCDGDTKPGHYLSSIFDNSGLPERPQRTAKWQTVLKKAEDNYQNLYPGIIAQFAESRGIGNPRAVRADQILAVIRDFTNSRRVETNYQPSNRLMISVVPALRNEWDILRTQAIESARFVDSSRPWSEQTGKVLELIEKVHKAGWLSDHDAEHDLRALSSVTGDDAPKILHQTARLLASDPPLIRRLQEIASDRPDSVAATSKFVTRARKAMNSIKRDLDESRSSATKDESPDDILQDLNAGLDQLEITIQKLGR